MGEEEKDTSGGEASNNVEEKKEKDAESGNDNKKEEMIIIKVDMHCHCEACAKKILKSLTTFQGVEDVAVDRKTNVVAIKGKTADPLKICDRIRHKTGRKAILLSPLPNPPPPIQDQPKDTNIQQLPKDQAPPVVTVVLGVHMHCEACAQLLRKRIRKMKGVESVETDVSKSQVIVKGVIADPEILVKYVHKRTRKQVTIIKDNNQEGEEKKQESSSSSEQEKKGEEDKKEKEEDNDKQGIKNNIMDDAKMMMMMNRYDYYWPSARYDYMEYHHHNNLNYQPQIFSDENPNACSIM